MSRESALKQSERDESEAGTCLPRLFFAILPPPQDAAIFRRDPVQEAFQPLGACDQCARCHVLARRAQRLLPRARPTRPPVLFIAQASIDARAMFEQSPEEPQQV